MEVGTEQRNTQLSVVLSVLFDIGACVICVVAWFNTSHPGYLIAGLGLIMVIPVAYNAPLTAAVLKAPVFSDIRKHRKLSTPLAGLSLVGNTIILFGLCYALFF